MWNRGTVGNLFECHRAKGSHPDRRNLIPQTRRLPSAPRFSGRLPQLRSIAPISPASAPISPRPAPNFRTAAPIFSTIAPIFRMTAPNSAIIAPNFSATAPIFPRVAPISRTTAPKFPPANPIYNCLFPSQLCGIRAEMITFHENRKIRRRIRSRRPQYLLGKSKLSTRTGRRRLRATLSALNSNPQ